MSVAPQTPATDGPFASIAERRAAGARVRREVLGAAHVTAAQAGNLFDASFTAFTEDFCWGHIWTRPGLDRRTRSLLNLVMLSSLGRWHEFEVHVHGAVHNGVSDEEIAEALLQAGVYAGIPVAAEGLRRARGVVAELRAQTGRQESGRTA